MNYYYTSLNQSLPQPTNNDLPSTRIPSKNNIRPIIIDQKGLAKLSSILQVTDASDTGL
jgi:hypothetical protein